MTATSEALEEFVAGERPDDVALFLASSYVDDDRLESFGDSVDGGVVIVVDGERGRNAFRAATGVDAMTFARSAMATEGDIEADLADGTCPDASADDTHEVRFVFAFAEAQNEAAGGLYADGDVIHAYARCACGTAYSDRWNASTGDRGAGEGD